jgi:hypothetical protein
VKGAHVKNEMNGDESWGRFGVASGMR